METVRNERDSLLKAKGEWEEKKEWMESDNASLLN